MERAQNRVLASPAGRPSLRHPQICAKLPFCYNPCPCGYPGDPVKECTRRVVHRILKLPLTIANLAGSDPLQTVHLAETIQYRPRLQF